MLTLIASDGSHAITFPMDEQGQGRTVAGEKDLPLPLGSYFVVANEFIKGSIHEKIMVDLLNSGPDRCRAAGIPMITTSKQEIAILDVQIQTIADAIKVFSP